MKKRVGVVGIVVSGGAAAAVTVQELLSQYASIIIGRMGVPDRAHNINIISVAVEGDVQTISALTGKLGRVVGVTVKSALTDVEFEEE